MVLMIFLARNIAINRDKLDESSTFWILLGTIVLVCAFVVGENLSTALLIFLAGYILLFFGGVNRRMWWRGFAAFAILGLVAFVVIYFFGDKMDLFRSSTWGHRLQAWLHPNPNELNQENMARMAVARGGFTGNGIGTTIHGRLMTQAHNDFIYAIIIEEVGMLGAIVIFLLYALFYFRCIRIANACKGLFGSLSVAGIGTVIFLQAFINMAVAVGVLPVTGQTLPFISYGGSSYVFLAMGVAVIQSVAIDNKKQRLAAQPQPSQMDAPAEEASVPTNK
jgi:cell division protein FtsW